MGPASIVGRLKPAPTLSPAETGPFVKSGRYRSRVESGCRRPPLSQTWHLRSKLVRTFDISVSRQADPRETDLPVPRYRATAGLPPQLSGGGKVRPYVQKCFNVLE